MYFLLPDEGTDVDDVMRDPQMLDLVLYDFAREEKEYHVNMSIPKFHIEMKSDVKDMLIQMGLTDVMTGAVDFSPILEETAVPFGIDAFDQSAMLEINEKGVVGAAFTEVSAELLALKLEDIDFILDRPFGFVITGPDKSIIFMGTVKNL